MTTEPPNNVTVSNSIARTNFIAEHRRVELIKIAYSIVAEKGFEDLRVREVAAQAGISSAIMHYYFPNKATLVQAVVQHLSEQFAKAHVEDFKVENDAPLQLLRRMFADLKYQMLQLPQLFIVAGELELRSLRDPVIAVSMREMYLTWREEIMLMLQHGIAQGVFRSDLDVTITALAITDLIKGFSYEGASRSEAAVDRLANQVERWLLNPQPLAETPH
jgi:AcrR family transcriptional regulator